MDDLATWAQLADTLTSTALLLYLWWSERSERRDAQSALLRHFDKDVSYE